MDTHSYDITRASLTPHAVQPIHRGGGDKIEPIEFTLAEHTDTNTRSNFWADLRYRADDFRLWLATRCCACLSSVPSLALVIIAAVLIMLLIATIPLAFALTYISPQASTVSDSADPNEDVRFFVHRPSTWPNESDMVNYKDWEDHVPVRSNLLLPKNISTCTVYGFACTGKPHIVIPKNRRCDGYADCEDGSDELDCHECQTTLFCPATDSQHSQRKLCLIGAHLCDNHTYCPNGEDETIYCQATCDDGQFKCRDADICIPEEAVCDGEPQCPFGDDEQSCTGECNNGAKKCGKDMCLAKRVLCDGYADCSDLSDEQDCDCSSCSGKNSALCNGDQKLCIAKEKVCDGRTDCPGGEDENGCHGVCPVTKASLEKKKNIGKRLAQNEMIKCADGRLHHWEEACNGDNPECSQSCSKCDPEMAFQCQSEFTQRMGNLSVIGFRNVSRSSNGSAEKEKPKTAGRLIIHRTFKECIHRSLVCDGKPDCSDASDELHCNCGGPETIKCRQDTATTMLVTHCYLKSQKCDGFADCAGKEDELGCDSCANGAFLCKNESRCIPSMARCDGIADCQDLSDETNCTCEECTRQPTQMYMCAGSNRCFPLESICGPYTMCPNATKLDHLFCAVRGKEYF